MSDLSANGRSSFGSMRCYNQAGSRPKFQPIRVKELVNFSDSDDEESEQKTSDSTTESETEDCLEEHGSKDVVGIKCSIEEPESSVAESKRGFQQVFNSKPMPSEHSNLRKSYNSNSDNGRQDNYKNHNFYQKNDTNAMQPSSMAYDRILDNKGSSGTENENHIHKHATEELLQKADHPIKSQNTPSILPSNHVINNYNLQASNTKYEMPVQPQPVNEEQTHGENFNSGKILTLEAGSLLHSVDHLTIDTPLKHTAIGCTRPKPCFSRRNIVEKPQSKLHTDLSKSHVPPLTPATVLSNWSHYNQRQTPLQTRFHSGKDNLQTPTSFCYFTPNTQNRGASNYFKTEVKSVRRPLADTTGSAQNDVPIVPLEPKSRILQGSLLSKMEERAVDSLNDLGVQRNVIAEKPAQPEINISEHSKEYKHPNMVGISENKEKPIQNLDVQSYAVKEHEKKSNPVVLESDRQDLKEIVNKISNVQFSIPSNPKSVRNEILTIKEKKYLILGELGQGMSGEVFRVQDLSNRELCAVKCVNLSRMDKDSAQGCLEEISLLHKLQASCVVRMFDYEIKYPMVYVVMEMGDIDLSRLLKSMSQEKHLPLTMILYYWTEMLTAVKYIHDNGVIHSDLKPANFLLVRGRLKLIDFGIASSMNADMTSIVKNCMIGTLNYISPEALMDIGENGGSPTYKEVKYKINFQSDVWSLGCILYSLVYGHTPFQHIRSQCAKISAITNPKPNIVFPPTMASHDKTQKLPTPPILIDVMRKCLQHDPHARPTVAQLLEIQYIPTEPERLLPLSRDIPSNILVKIRHALNEAEWRQLIQILESRR